MPIPFKKIGAMQGRLSQNIEGKIQCFPTYFWKEEFETAEKLGLDSIQWVFDLHDWKKNPIMTEEGRVEIKRLCTKHNIKIHQVCGDYFMERPLFGREDKAEASKLVLIELVLACTDLGIKGIEIPLVDNGSIRGNRDLHDFTLILNNLLPFLREQNIEIGLESDMAPFTFRRLLESIDDPMVKANYDTGNSAHWGFDTEEEIKAYGKYISNVHIKDRTLGGFTCPLGLGNAEIGKSMKLLHEIGYDGPVILQVARDRDDIKVIKDSLAYLDKEWDNVQSEG